MLRLGMHLWRIKSTSAASSSPRTMDLFYPHSYRALLSLLILRHREKVYDVGYP